MATAQDETPGTGSPNIPSSPSTSSLTSDSSAFDPHAEPRQSPDQRVLGVRELVEMSRTRRSPVIPTGSRQVKLVGGDTADVDAAPSYIAAVGRRGSPPSDAAAGRNPRVDESGGEVFSKDVRISGWKVVGGKSWTGKAKVGAYVVYEIEITLYTGGTISVLRRYTDFVQLRRSLKAKYPQLEKTIPALPGKAHMSKFDPKFLGERQPRLQRFLRGVMLHPEMGKGGRGSVVGDWVMDKNRG